MVISVQIYRDNMTFNCVAITVSILLSYQNNLYSILSVCFPCDLYFLTNYENLKFWVF